MMLVTRTARFLTVAAQFCLLAADGPRFTVSGVVVNSLTSEPLPHALVQSTGAEQKVAFTGQDGRFQLEGVPQGTVFFLAQKPGFFDAGGRRTPVRVGSDTSLVTIKLAPESSIEGRVVDSDGEAIEGLPIQCMHQAIINGRKTWQTSCGAQTDETGNFHLQGLQPGSYLLRTNSQPLFPNFNFQNANDSLPQQAYPPHFYPDAADVSSAQPLVLHAGETARADFAIAPVPAFRVSGTASPAQGGTFGWVQSADGERNLGFMVDPRTGAWHTPALPAGSWNIVLQSMRGRDSGFSAEQSVNITTSDIKNVQMHLEPLPSIPVNVISAAPANQRQVQIQLMPDGQSLGNGRMLGSNRSPQNLDETPMVRSVPPGSYTVFAIQYGSECLASISAGGVDLARSPLVVSAGGQPASIDVTLEDNCASIQGQVHMDNPVANASVILAPSSRAIQPQLAALQEDGSFSFNRVSPGDYRLYAVSTADGLEYGNPEAMRQINGTSITLAAKQKASVTLNLVARDGN
jgi:carboxypeptidase family protein